MRLFVENSLSFICFKTIGIVAWLLVLSQVAFAGYAQESNAVIRWDKAALQGVRDSKQGAPVVARALAIVHTCMYDAWTAYDDHAVGTELQGVLRRPSGERTLVNKERAISYAAYRALNDVMPVDSDSVYTPLMKELGYDPADISIDIDTAAGIGSVACDAVLEFRHHDKANQLGDLAQGAYSDWSNYQSINTPGTAPARTTPSDPDHWQPLTYVDSTGNVVAQRFAGAQWCYVTPFALTKGEQFRSALQFGPAKYGSREYEQQAAELVAISAGLTDRQKMISEYWSDGPRSEQPPGHWALFAQFVSERDHHNLDDDVKMFFVLTNAMLDAGIAAWDAKRAYDSIRPVTAISLLYRSKKIRAWGGPGKGTIELDGSQWIPYQPASFPTPPFPDYVSGHSTYSSAAARTLALWTGSDHFGDFVVLPEGSSKIEPSLTPKQSVTLKWETFSGAADEAGMSRRYGGIHFARADLDGRKLGRLVADVVWSRAQQFFSGAARPATRVDFSVENSSLNR